MELKLSDFGLSCKLADRQERRTDLCGTPNYLAPEQLLSSKTGHSLAVDMWALGVLIYTCLYGVFPFTGKNQGFDELRLNIIDVRYGFPSEPAVSNHAKDLIGRLLVKDEWKRLKVD